MIAVKTHELQQDTCNVRAQKSLLAYPYKFMLTPSFSASHACNDGLSQQLTLHANHEPDTSLAQLAAFPKYFHVEDVLRFDQQANKIYHSQGLQKKYRGDIDVSRRASQSSANLTVSQTGFV